MRLLNTGTGEIREFISDEDVPPYAILSHTWGDEEVSLAQWETLPWPEVSAKIGYAKIRGCCRQAVEDGLEWVWIDT